jgi:hypothetical protein
MGMQDIVAQGITLMKIPHPQQEAVDTLVLGVQKDPSSVTVMVVQPLPVHQRHAQKDLAQQVQVH